MLGTMVAMFAASRLAGCTGKEPSKMTSTASIELPGLTVRLSIEQAGKGAKLSYLATATGRQTVFLLDGIHDDTESDGKLLMRKAPWVTVDNRGAVLAARFFEPPQNMFVNTLNFPLPTRIAAGETAQRSFTVPVPIMPDMPYQTFGRPKNPDVLPRPISFELGYFFGRPGTEQMARTIQTSEGPRPAFDAVNEEGQMIARLGPLGEIPVVVNATEG